MEHQEFEARNRDYIARMAADKKLNKLSQEWMVNSAKYEYGYHFTWMGRPIIQHPQDILALQEIIWRVKPELIIETGIARGGSIIFYASILDLIGGSGQVVGIDIDIRKHNKIEIEKHPMFKRIVLLEGSSIDEQITKQVYEIARGKYPIMVLLDSNHTHNHVFRELELYSPLVTKDSYLVVFDTIIEEMPSGFYRDRPWDTGNNPYTAVQTFLQATNRFEIDQTIEDKLLITAAPKGFLKCIEN